MEASGDAPEQDDKEQEPEKMAEDDEHSGDEGETQPTEPKKKVRSERLSKVLHCIKRHFVLL